MMDMGKNWSGREDLNLRPPAPHTDIQTTLISLFYINFIPAPASKITVNLAHKPLFLLNSGYHFRRPQQLLKVHFEVTVIHACPAGTGICTNNSNSLPTGGEPVIRGTRVTLRTILASLAEGDSQDDLLKDFPTLTEADVRAVIAFAAASAEEDLPLAEIPRAS